MTPNLDHFHGDRTPQSAARALRWQAIRLLAWMLPKPRGIASGIAVGARKLRLETELAEFDFRYRLLRGRPANLAELHCAGMVLLTNCKGALPTRVLPEDEELLINSQTFDVLLGWVDERLENLGSS